MLKNYFILITGIILIVGGVSIIISNQKTKDITFNEIQTNMTKKSIANKDKTPEVKKELKKATFAAGCFWCIKSDFEKLNHSGIIDVVSGYSGGIKKNPTSEEVSSGSTGHKESIQITYDPDKISYEELLATFWKNVDPTDSKGQFCDKGNQYTSAIFFHDSKQKKLAEASKEKVENLFNEPIVTEILEYKEFYPAEDYHQDYHKKNPIKYNSYRFLCGRDRTLKDIWENKSLELGPKDNFTFSKPSDQELQKILTPIQYKVTQKDGTEPPFDNEYHENKKEGIYVDIISGEPLFSSLDKFDSGTGWPSFTKPLSPNNIVEKNDYKLLLKRTEVRSKNADSHLGHVFNDGPEPTGKRYCMNSAALKFIPKENLKKEGYAEYLKLFS